VHQDIKPSNYLISKKSQTSPYDFDVKLADFGYSFTNIRGNDDGNTGIRDLGGGQTYGTYHIDEMVEQIDFSNLLNFDVGLTRP
jgi:serine/threonine protein kinase